MFVTQSLIVSPGLREFLGTKSVATLAPLLNFAKKFQKWPEIIEFNNI